MAARLIRLTSIKNKRILHLTAIMKEVYCTAQQNIMTAFLAGKLVREKNGRFERHGIKRWKFVAKKEKTAERKF